MLEKDYRLSHIEARKSEQYENIIYKKYSYDDFLWQYEKKILRQIIAHLPIEKRTSYLDFACGTGRIISLLEKFFKKSFGIDNSEEMVKKARDKVFNSELFVVDITKEDILHDTFDVITAFRFFLNAGPSLRRQVLEQLVPRLKTKESLFIFNIHGNLWSHRIFTKVWYLTKHKKLNTLSYRNSVRLAEDHGLRVEWVYGFGVVPKFFYRMFPTLWFMVDRAFSFFPGVKYFSYNLIFVCKTKNAHADRV